MIKKIIRKIFKKINNWINDDPKVVEDIADQEIIEDYIITFRENGQEDFLFHVTKKDILAFYGPAIAVNGNFYRSNGIYFYRDNHYHSITKEEYETRFKEISSKLEQ